MPRPHLPSWPTTLTTLAVLTIHLLVLWLLSDLLFNRPPTESITPGPYLISALVLSTLLLPILILALRGRRPRGLRHCPRCWYTLDPALGLKCSECGHEAKSDRQTRKPRRRYKLAAAILCLIALCQLMWLETRIRLGGWLAAVPTDALILATPYAPMSQIYTPTSAMGHSTLLGRRHRSAMSDRQAKWAADALGRRVCNSPNADAMLHELVLLTLFCDAQEHDAELLLPEEAQRHAFRTTLEPLLRDGTVARDSHFERAAILIVGRWWSHDDDTFSATTATLIDEFSPQLLELFRRNHPHDAHLIASLFARGNGPPEVVGAMILDADKNGVTAELLRLASRQPQVADRVAEVLLDPIDPRRALLSRGISMAFVNAPHPKLVTAMETVILSDDPELVLAAIEGLAGVRDVPRLQHLAAARGLHFIESHPERALECLKLLRSYDEALVPLAAEWARLTHSDHLDVRAAAISILAKISWYPEQVDPVHRQILISVAESEHIINDDRTARWFRTRIRNLVRHGAWSTTH